MTHADGRFALMNYLLAVPVEARTADNNRKP